MGGMRGRAGKMPLSPTRNAPLRILEHDDYLALRADARVPYGRVAELIGLVQDAGLSRVGFITEAAK